MRGIYAEEDFKSEQEKFGRLGASPVPGHRPASRRRLMAKKSRVSRVRCLTLAPATESRDLVDTGLQVDVDDEESRMLQREQMARAMDISLIAGQGKHQSPHIHGVEHGMGSKFWANGDDYSSAESMSSSDESDDEVETSSPTLVKETG
jgi:hypothetical protein